MVDVTLIKILNSMVNVTVCTNSFPATILGHVFNAPGALADTVESTTGGCDTARTINVTAIPLLTSTVNVAVCTNSFPATILGHLFNAPGTLTEIGSATSRGRE